MNKKTISNTKKYQKRVGPGRITMKDINFSNVPMKSIARLFGLDVSTVGKWDCQRLSNGNYDAAVVVQWYIEKMKKEPNGKTDLEKEKLRLQCEKLEIEIDERQKNSITIADHNAQITEAMLAFKGYFVDYGKMNLHTIANQPIESLRKYWDELVRLGLNHFSEKKIQ